MWEACGSSDEGWKNLLSTCVKPSDVKELLQHPMYNAIQKEIRGDAVFKDLSNLLSCDIQYACDEAGISTKGYEAIHNVVKDVFRMNGLTCNMFPTPKRVRLAKWINNDDVRETLGDYYHVEGTLTLISPKGKANSSPIVFQYNSFNNIFVDLILLQKAMMKFYRFPSHGKNPSIFGAISSMFLLLTLWFIV